MDLSEALKIPVTISKPPKILPPVYWVIAAGLILFLDQLIPAGISTGPVAWGLGGCLIYIGVFLVVIPTVSFNVHNTSIFPFQRSTKLIETGPYAVTRNPMYLGMSIVLLGITIGLGNLFTAIVPITFLWVIQKRFVEPEELFLEKLFDDRYLSYKHRVRRWV